MKKWRTIWGAVILAEMLGGCQRDYSAADPFQLYDYGFGKPEAEVVERFSLDEQGWIHQPSSINIGYGFPSEDTVRYQRARMLETGGHLAVSVHFSETYGLCSIGVAATNLPTNPERFYDDAMALYRMCEKRFGTGGVTSEADQAYWERLTSYHFFPPNASVSGEPVPPPENHDWTVYADFDALYTAEKQEFDGEATLTNRYLTTEEDTVKLVYIRASCTDPEAEEMTADFAVSILRDMTDWEDMERRRADAE